MNNGGHPQGCKCGMCMGSKMGLCGSCGGHHMGFHILRWILGILVLVMVFSFGVKIGEFKEAFEAGSGYHHSRFETPMMIYTAPASVTATPAK